MPTTLISPNEVVNGGTFRPVPTNSRFDSQLLAPNVAIAEERFLVPVLCISFYNDLIAEKTSDDSNYNPNIGTGVVVKFGTNANYETLWREYLMEVAARAVYVQSLKDIAIQTGSNGLYMNNSQYSDNAGVQGLRLKEDRAMDDLRLATNRMKRYLCENSALYPLWPSDDFCCDCGTSVDDDCNCSSSKAKDRNNNDLGVLFY